MDPVTLFLVRCQLLVWKIPHSPSSVFCLEGSLWLTRTADQEDYLLGSGESMLLKPGVWVVQALEASRVQKRTLGKTKEVAHGETGLFPVLQRL
jgi:hypothetical protein